MNGRLDVVSCWYCSAPAQVFVPTGAQFRLPEGLSASVNGKDRYVCPACVRSVARGETPKVTA